MAMTRVDQRRRFGMAVRCGGAILLAFALSAAGALAQEAMPRVELSIGMYRLDAEVAARDQDRERGLMHRRHLPGNSGMLFIFPAAAGYCMWMKNTLIPLSVAFIDDEGRIVNIAKMAPQTEDSHCAAQPARFALEMNQGWFAQRGLAAGAMVRGLPGFPAAR